MYKKYYFLSEKSAVFCVAVEFLDIAVSAELICWICQRNPKKETNFIRSEINHLVSENCCRIELLFHTKTVSRVCKKQRKNSKVDIDVETSLK